MKIKSGVEQAVSILVVLATQRNNEPVNSATLSEILNTSPSFLSKIMRKLVVGGLVTSVSGNNGGFTLAKPANDMTVLQVFEAIEGKESFLQQAGIFRSVFNTESLIDKGEKIVDAIFNHAEKNYRDTLAHYTFGEALSRLLESVDISSFDHNAQHNKSPMKNEGE